jgi:hypothetical protein
VSETKLPMTAGETLLDSFRATRTQDGLGVSGRFYLTSQRLVLLPNRLDAAGGGVSWEIPLGSVSLVDVAPRGLNPFSNSTRRRLRITTVDSVDHFVVSHVAQVVERIEEARRGHVSDPFR